MTTNPQQPDTDLVALALVVGAAIAAIAATVLIAGTYLAALATSFAGPGITWRQILVGFHHLLGGAPTADAFPEPAASRLPTAPWLWASVAAVGALGCVPVAQLIVWRSNHRTGLDNRRRLGVDAQPRFATTAEKRTLHMTTPTPGRFAYATDGRHVLATHRHSIDHKRRTIPGALAMIGPSRSGKTHTATIGAQLWQGPAIISSVKTDLLDPTLAARQALGDVRVYDPSGLTRHPSAHWSPLHDAHTLEGAQRSAKRLLSAVQLDRSGHGEFWSRHGETLLGGLMWLAANTPGLTMADVARWVNAMDEPTADDPGEVATYLRALATNEGLATDLVANVQTALADVQANLSGVWRADGRVSSSYFTSARHAVAPWTRDAVRRISATTTIDLDWLTSGDNTLYLTAPLIDQDLLAPAFGGLIADLVDQAILRHERNQPVERGVLLLLDETANVPLVQLPHWASTIAGNNIQLVTIWQSKGQIDAAYGDDADTVLANHRTQVFFPGISDPATARYIGDLLGDEHQPGYVNATASFADLARHQPDPATGVPLVPSNVLRQLGDDDRLVITSNLPPLHARALARIPRRWRHHTRIAES